MTATLLTIDPRIAERNCRAGLMDLARRWGEHHHWERHILLTSQVHPSWDRSYPVKFTCVCGRCLGCTWEGFRASVAQLDGLIGEPWAEHVTWEDVDEGLTGPDRTTQARDRAAELVESALNLLMRGRGL
jgi:hypothetical protein